MPLTRREWILGSLGVAAMQQVLRAQQHAGCAAKAAIDGQRVDPVDAFYTSRHLMGTCRMGTNPAKSVVNSFGRAHDVPNLFIVDGSNFVTSA